MPGPEPDLTAHGPAPAARIHLHPTAALASRVLLPGDPGRALALARTLLERPLMFNHHRGLWGYTGVAADDELLTIQSTGMGGPSAAIVFEELVDLGVTRAIRVGTCGGFAPDLDHGALVLADRALPGDGASRALGAPESGVDGDPTLTAALVSAAGAQGIACRVGTVVSADLFYDPDPARAAGWRADGAIAVEMEAATLFQIGARRGVAVGCALIVSDTAIGPVEYEGEGGRDRIDAEALQVAAQTMGDVAAAALA